jgi:hypothetical protein
MPNDKILVKSGAEYKKYDINTSSWAVVTTTTPTEADFLNGMNISDIELIPESAWQELSGEVEILYYTDNPNKTEAEFIIDTNEFTLADELGDSISIIEYTDNPNQTSSTVTLETEPFTFYDEMGDSFDVLYYTDDPNKTSADLEITANYSPLDEFDEDFEVVTWTNEDADERKIQMTALPKGQLLVSTTDIKIYGDLKSIIVNKISQAGLNDGIVRLLLSFDDGVTWKSHNGIDWIVVNKDDVNDVINNGLTLDILSTLTSDDFETQLIDEYVKIVYYLEENIRDTDIAQIDSVQFENKVPTETTEVNDMALYILNTKSTINVTFNANHVEGQVLDDDAGRVQYRVILNGSPFYPQDGSFTPLKPSPVNINLKLRNDDILIGQNNVLRIEFQDYWGNADYWEAHFVGTYAGLMFSDPNGDYYTTDLGQLLKYMDFGVLVAGQTSLENEVILTDKYGYPIENLKVKAINNMIANGVKLELSKTNTPFIAEDELTFDQVLNHDEMVSFYVRLSTQITATPVASGTFEIRANAKKV